MIGLKQMVLLVLLYSAVEGSTFLRTKRFLVFPRQAPTRHQFIGGIGIPADLTYESLVVGHVLKAQFFLPYNSTVFRENPYLPEYSLNRNSPSSLRWGIYEFIAKRFQSYGYNGKECLLKAICEANSVMFCKDSNVFNELMHIFLSPTSSVDSITTNSVDYIEAERLGRSKTQSCDIFDCNTSLLQWISHIFPYKFAK